MGRNSTNNDNSAVGAEFASVVSPNGFSTGDLVYRSPNGYGVMPNGAVSSATFPVTVNNLDTRFSQQTSAVVYNDPTFGSGQSDYPAALLTNGNIVVVYRSSFATAGVFVAGFRIVDQNNNEVVGLTTVATTGTNYYTSQPTQPVSVCALTGGGFVVFAFTNDAGSLPLYRVYDNNGVAVSAALNWTGVTNGTSFYNFYAEPRPDGRFLLSIVNGSTGNFVLQAFNANGTAYSSLQSLATTPNRKPSIVVFDDNRTLTVHQLSGTLYWSLFNAAVTSSSSGSFSIINNADLALAALSDGAALYANDGSGNIRYAKFTLASATWGSVSILSSTVSAYLSTITAYRIPATNNHLIFYPASGSGSNPPINLYCLGYSLVNGAAGSVTSSFATTQISQIGTPFQPVLIPLTGKYRVYSRLGNGTSSGTPATGSATGYFDIDASTYQLIPFSYINATIGTSTAAVSTYSKANSTPTGASFFASATSTATVTIAAGTVLKAQTAIDNTTSNAMCFVKLNSGNFLIVWKTTGGTIKFSEYDTTGTQVGSTVTVTTSASGSTGLMSACQLTNGKIVVAWYASGTGTTNANVYSSSYVLLNSITPISGSSTAICVAPLYYANRFVITDFNASQYPRYTVFTDTATIAVSTTTINAAIYRLACVVPLQNGGFWVWVIASAGSVDSFYYAWGNLSNVNSYTRYSGNPMGVASYDMGNIQPCYPNPGGAFGFVNLVGANLRYQTANTSYMSGMTSAIAFSTPITIPGSGAYLAHTVDSLGNYVVLELSTPTLIRTGFTGAGVTVGSNGELATSLTSVLPSRNASVANLAASLTSLYGPYVVVGCTNSSAYPTFAIVAASDYSASATLTAGVTPSNPVTIDTSNGFSLIGVAASDCAAGGAGQVQTKGTAVLSSSYPTTTQTFDFTNPVTYGVKGTVSNRVITLED